MENEQTSNLDNFLSHIIGFIVIFALAYGYLCIRDTGFFSSPKLIVEEDGAYAKVPVNVTYRQHRRHTEKTVNLALVPYYLASFGHQLWLMAPAKDWFAQEGDSVFLIGEGHRKMALYARWATGKGHNVGMVCPLTPEQWEELKDFPLQKVVVSCQRTHKAWDCQRFAGRNLGNAIKKIEQVKPNIKISTLPYKPSSLKEKYEGETKNGVPHGHGKIFYKNGEVFEGEFEDGERNGPGKLIYPSGEVTEGIWVNGVKV